MSVPGAAGVEFGQALSELGQLNTRGVVWTSMWIPSDFTAASPVITWTPSTQRSQRVRCRNRLGELELDLDRFRKPDPAPDWCFRPRKRAGSRRQLADGAAPLAGYPGVGSRARLCGPRRRRGGARQRSPPARLSGRRSDEDRRRPRIVSPGAGTDVAGLK